MNDKTTPSGRRFQGAIYRDLDRKLKDSPWQSGASEAHGLLTALACRGVSGERIATKAWLFRLSEPTDLDLLEGMYGLILGGLHSDSFEFELLLADESFDHAQRVESLANWCGGFIQGFFHHGEDGGGGEPSKQLERLPVRVRESVDDLMKISRADLAIAGDNDPAGEATERQLFEIEQYLRVAIQVIFEELNSNQTPPTSSAAATASTHANGITNGT